MAWPAWAAEYRVQVTHVDYLTFSAYMGKATPWWRQNEPMGGLEARLDAQEFSPAAVLPGREVLLLEDPAYGGMVPARVSHLPATGRQPWTTYVFDGNPGDTVVFMVKSEMVAWQRVWATAINGVSVVVGRGRSLFYNPDRVYMLIKLPPEPRTFKLVIGWKDHDDRGTDGTNGEGTGRTSSR